MTWDGSVMAGMTVYFAPKSGGPDDVSHIFGLLKRTPQVHVHAPGVQCRFSDGCTAVVVAAVCDNPMAVGSCV